MRCFMRLLEAVLIATLPAMAQTSRGRVLGTVTDTSGAVVSISHTATGVTVL